MRKKWMVTWEESGQEYSSGPYELFENAEFQYRHRSLDPKACNQILWEMTMARTHEPLSQVQRHPVLFVDSDPSDYLPRTNGDLVYRFKDTVCVDGHLPVHFYDIPGTETKAGERIRTGDTVTLAVQYVNPPSKQHFATAKIANIENEYSYYYQYNRWFIMLTDVNSLKD